MYHCNLCFYLIGNRDNLFDVLKNMEPLPHFTHEFVQSAEPEVAHMNSANVIIADVNDEDVDKLLKNILNYKNEKTELIMLADKEQIKQLMTVRQARAILVGVGVCAGKTLGEVADTRAPSLKWYAYGPVVKDNVLRAGALVMLEEQQKAG